MFPLPTLLCDIGGTNARFALLDDSAAGPRPLPSCKTSDFSSFSNALRDLFARETIAPNALLACAAGPVEGARVQLTNASWVIDGREVARDLGLRQGLMFNDFEALALSIPAFQADWLRPVGSTSGAPRGARVIHGPGTGLGTAALIEVGGKWWAIASEGSHSDFAPLYEDEHRIWPYIEKRLGRITPESLISGPGLRRLHRARCAALGGERPDTGDADIIARALDDFNSAEAESVRLFWRLAARYAGDVALNFLATGGVIFAGGILPRIAALLDENEFQRMFTNKAPYDELANRIPLWLLTRPDAVLHGMAAIARDPARYAIDYAKRLWNP